MTIKEDLTEMFSASRNGETLPQVLVKSLVMYLVEDVGVVDKSEVKLKSLRVPRPRRGRVRRKATHCRVCSTSR